MGIFFLSILGIILIIIIALIGMYNRLVSLRNRVRNGWSQIDVQLNRRYDLIPNLVEVAKRYLKHEEETFKEVTRARQQAVDLSGSGNVAKQAQAENLLSRTLRSLFAVVENYPDLKANQNMIRLQEELTSTENRIAFARQYYNDEVMRYNTTTERFPDNIMADMFKFQKAEFFELEDISQRESVEIKF